LKRAWDGREELERRAGNNGPSVGKESIGIGSEESAQGAKVWRPISIMSSRFRAETRQGWSKAGCDLLPFLVGTSLLVLADSFLSYKVRRQTLEEYL
jgi:hypothetical protein